MARLLYYKSYTFEKGYPHFRNSSAGHRHSAVLQNQMKGTRKRAWYWDANQKAFDDVKATISKDVVLAYPDYSKSFEIYTDASTKQLGAVITG